VNGTAELACLEEIGLLEVEARRDGVRAGGFQSRGPYRANFMRQPHFDQEPYSGAPDQPQDAVSDTSVLDEYGLRDCLPARPAP